VKVFFRTSVINDLWKLPTKIPYVHGLAALEFFLNRRPKPHIPTTAFLLNLANLVLTYNKLTLENKHYLQIRVTPIRTRMTPSYSNLFKDKLEHDFLQPQPLTPLLWIRFLNDVLILWTHGEASLKTYLE